MLRIDIERAIGDYIANLDKDMPSILRRASGYASVGMADRQKVRAPIRHGGLRSSIHTDREIVPSNEWIVSAGTSANIEYAFFQEYGTGFKGDGQTFDGQPIIHTDKKSWMYTDADGVQQYGHPMEGRHFMRDGIREETLAKDFADELTRLMNQ